MKFSEKMKKEIKEFIMALKKEGYLTGEIGSLMWVWRATVDFIVSWAQEISHATIVKYMDCIQGETLWNILYNSCLEKLKDAYAKMVKQDSKKAKDDLKKIGWFTK